jgi:hypothetical protein
MLLFLADTLLVIHALFVAFVVLGLGAVYLGGWCGCGWRWVRNPLFRALHLLAIAVVVLQSWLGIICPLTTWEMALRERAGGATYSGSFIQHWLHEWLFYTWPDWVFITLYTAFGALVLVSWIVVRPRRWRR